MRIGYDSDFKICRTYMQFPTLQAKLSNLTIMKATLHANVNYTNSKSKATLERVSQSWSASSLNWSNKPTSVNDVTSSTVTMTSGTKYWDVTKTVQQWAAGINSNFGFCIKATEEGSSSGSFANFYGSRHATSSVRPYLYVTAPTFEFDSVITSTRGGDINSGVNYLNVVIHFSIGNYSGYSGSGEHYSLVISPTGNVNDSRNITYSIDSEMVWDDWWGWAEITWDSYKKSNFLKNYGGLPDNPSKIFGAGVTDYYVAVKVSDQNNISSRTGSFTKLTSIVDRTPPGIVNVNNITSSIVYVKGSIKDNAVKVSFSGVTDDKSGMQKYDVAVTDKNGKAKIVSVNHNPSNNNYTVDIPGVDLMDPYLTISIKAYDMQGNYSTATKPTPVDISRADVRIMKLDKNLENDIDYKYIKAGSTVDFKVTSNVSLSEVTLKIVHSTTNNETLLYENKSANLKTLNEQIQIQDISMFEEDVLYRLVLEAKRPGMTSIDERNVLISSNNLTGDIINIEDPFSELSGVTDILLNVDGSYYFDNGAHYENGENLRTVKFDLSLYQNNVLVKELTNEKTIYVFDTTLIPNGDYELRLHIEDDDDHNLDVSKNIVINNQFRKFDYLDWKRIDNNEIELTIGYEVFPYLSNQYYYKINGENTYHEIGFTEMFLRQLIINDNLLTEPDTNIIRFYHLTSESNAIYSEVGVLTIAEDSSSPNIVINNVDKINGLNKFILDVDITDDNSDYWDVYGYINNEDLIQLKHSTEDGQGLKYLLDITGTELANNNFTLVVKAVDKGKNITTEEYQIDLSTINNINVSGLIDDPNITMALDHENDHRNHLYIETGINNQVNEEVHIKVYKGYESGFIPASDNYYEFIVDGIGPVTFNYFDNKLMFDSESYYVVEVIKVINNIHVSFFSDEYSIKSIGNEKFSKRIGTKAEYETANISIPNSNAQIELSGGNLLINDIDLELRGIGFDLTFGRIYNSQSDNGGFFGKHWTMGVNYQIYQIDSIVGNQVVIDHFIYVDNTGAFTKFYPRENSTTEFMSSNPEFDVLKIVDDQLQIETRRKIKLYFDKRGKIKEVVDPNNNTLAFVYDEKTDYLISITNKALITTDSGSEEGSSVLLSDPNYNNGKSLANFYFNNNRLQRIEVPNERSIEYTYNILGYLSKVKYYGYENNNKVLLSKKSYGYTLIDHKLDVIYDGMENAYSLHYDQYGKVDKVKYPNNEGFTINYDNEVLSRNVSLNNYIKGSTIISTSSYVFDSDGRALSITDSSGNTVNNVYKNGYMVKTTWQSERATIVNNQVVTQLIPLSNTYQYDKKGNLIKFIDERDNSTIYVYDDDNNVTSTKSYTMNEDLYEDESYQYALTVNQINIELSQMTDNLENITTDMDYNDNGDMNHDSTIVNGVGELSNSKYDVYYDDYLDDDDDYDLDDIDFNDEYRYTVETEEESNGNMSIETITVSDKYGNTLYDKDEKGYYTQYLYDGLSRIIETRKYDDPHTVQSSYKSTFNEYDYNNSLSKESYKEYYSDSNGNPTNSSVVTIYQYDDMNRLIKTTTTPNLVTTTTYSYENVTVCYGDQSEVVNNAFKETTNHDDGTVSIQWKNHKEDIIKSETATELNYYKNDRHERFVIVYNSSVMGNSNDGLLTYTLYDEFGNQTGELKNPSNSNGKIELTLNTVADFTEYNRFGNAIKETDSEGNYITYIYNNEQKMVGLLDQYGNRYHFFYDIYQKKGDQVINIHETTYPNSSNEYKDKKNPKSEEIYDSYGNLVETKDWGDRRAPIITRYEYDESGNVIRENHIHHGYVGNYQLSTYDENNNPLIVTSYLEGGVMDYQTSYVYDKNEKLITQIDKDGNSNIIQVRKYMYDIQGRIIGYYEGTNVDPSVNDYFTYEYDIKDNLSIMNYPLSGNHTVKSIKYSYNNKNLPIKEEVKLANQANYKTIREYIYDEYYRESEIIDHIDLFSNVPINISRKINTYDIFGRISSIEYKDTNNINMETHTYGYSSKSQIINESIVDQYSNSNTVKSYEYDKAGRLLTYMNNSDRIDYAYDNVGNRISECNNGITRSYEYNLLNQLTSSCIDDKENYYYYDYYGNQWLNNEGGNNVYVYEYNSQNHLKKISLLNMDESLTTVEENVYNGDGTRISKTIYNNGVAAVKNYNYERGNLYSTDNDNGVIITENINDNHGSVISAISNNQIYNYHKDIRGSTTNIIDSNNNMNLSYMYLSFGETTITTGNGSILDNEICYTGAIYDNETGLYYMNARYYNPSNARFTSQDTYRGDNDDYQSFHLYAYCANDPVNKTDKSGYKYLPIDDENEWAPPNPTTRYKAPTKGRSLGCKFKCNCKTHKGNHRGVDIHGKEGADLYAITAGKISFVGDRKDGYGKTITLKPKEGKYKYKYCHLKKIIVTKKTFVKAGDLIGYIGHTGKTVPNDERGAHLHLEKMTKKRNIRKNPIKILKELGYK